MSKKTYQLKPNDTVPPCPKCGNNTHFICHSEQVAEDCCEIWVVCKCGHNPHSSGDKLEDVWGGVGWDDFIAALQVYKELLHEQTTQP